MLFPGRGANVRRLDRVNYLAADIPAVTAFLPGVLGAELTEQIVIDPEMAAAAIEALHAARASRLDWLREHLAAEAGRSGRRRRPGSRGSYQHARRREHEMAAATDLLNELSVPPRVTRASQRWLNQLATEG